jgi:elongation factor G
MALPIEKKRNVALIGHGGSGKTTLAEAVLFRAGITTRMGSVEDGNTVSDNDPEEIRRKYSIRSSVLPFDYDNHHFTLIDCPGYLDFIGEAISALHAVDGAVICVNAVAGVEPQTRLAWKYCERLKLPRLLFVSQLDRENASFEKAIDACRQAFGKSVAPLVITMGEQTGLKGVINVLSRKAYIREGDKTVVSDPPAEYSAAVEAARATLIESIVELDDDLMVRYMEDDTIGEDELQAALLAGTLRGDFCPALGGSSKLLIGMGTLLSLLQDCLPHPGFRKLVEGKKPAGGEDSRPLTADAPFLARVFKISSEGQLGEIFWMRVLSGQARTGDAMLNPNTGEMEKFSALLLMRGKTREDLTVAQAGDICATVKLKKTHIGDTLTAKEHQFVLPLVEYPSAVAFECLEVDDKNDFEKAMQALNFQSNVDPTLRIVQNEETKEQVVYGMGQLHLDIAASAVKAKTGVGVKWKKPRIPYRETITQPAQAQGKYKKQTGGRGKFGDCHLKLEPRDRGAGYEFVDAVVGGVIPNRFIPAIEKGVVETMEHGPLSGSRVIDTKVTVFFGSAHSVDSDELSFKVAGSMAFKQAFEHGSPILLEPVYDVCVLTPDKYTGDIMGDMNSRRGRVAGMDQNGDLRQLNAQVPLAEMYQYINTLRSMTQGQGSFEMKFSHYEQVPSNVQSEIVKHYQATRKQEED